MKKTTFILTTLFLGISGISNASAHDSVGFSLNIGAPAYYYQPPVVYEVPRVYYSRPIYESPAPIYYQPYGANIYYGDNDRRFRNHHEWRRHHEHDDDD